MESPRGRAVEPGRFTEPFLLYSLVIITIIFPSMASAEQASAGESGPASGTTDTLMLVREWDPETGTLTGWLPLHYAAIQLELLSKTLTPQFELDQAVYLTWPRMRNNSLQETHLRVSPAPRVFEGESWLPVKRDPNLVRIGKALYLVRGIILNGAKWRQSAKASTAAKSVAQNDKGR